MKLAERLGKRRATSRGFHTAVVTTFAVDFAGFEQVVLPQLAAAGATNILLVCDARMSAMALSDGSLLPQQLGRDYALHGPAQSAGVFHPKVVVQLGRDGGRAFVGSANATASGRPVGGADVLRLRFWLMLLIHAARWRRYREGLPCTVDDFGWPRLVMRVLSTFYYGRDAPIVRLVVENAYLDLPVDFLETWATALWLVDLLPQAVGRCHGREEFLKRVPVLRQCMLQRMGLTREELEGAVMSRVREGLDLDLGARLRHEGAASAPAVSDVTAKRSRNNGKAVAGAR